MANENPIYLLVSTISGLVFEEVGEILELKLPFHRSWVKSIDSLQQLMIDAGLEIERGIKHQGYDPPKEYSSDAGAMLFDKSVPATNSDDPAKDLNASARGLFVEKLGAPDVRNKARALFAEIFEKRAGRNGVVREEDYFYVVIGRKI